MSYKFFTFDITEYAEFEKKLNEFSQQGINPIEISYLSSFEKNQKHYYYVVDVLKDEKHSPRKQTQNRLINLYDRNDYRYCGKKGNMIVFKSESKRKLPKGREEIRKKYIEDYWLSQTIWFLLMMAIVVFVASYLILSKDLKQVQTNGYILLHWMLLLCPLSIEFILFNRIMRSIQSKANRNMLESPLKKAGYLLLVISIVGLLLSFGLDFMDRGTKAIDDSIITLKDINCDTNTKEYPEYSWAESYIVDSKTYLEENKEGDILYTGIYQIKDGEEASYFETFKESHLDQDVKEIEKNVFIYTVDTENDSMIALKNKKIIEVSTTKNLLENDIYKLILEKM